MIRPRQNTVPRRIGECFVRSLPQAIRTSAWLLLLMLPISLLVQLLAYFGVLDLMSRGLAPVFSVFGLSGTAPLVFITAATLNIYSAIAVIGTLSLTIREITILALMCLIAHNLPIETAVQKRTGSSAVAILATRVIGAFLGAWMLALLLPGAPAAAVGTADVVSAVPGIESEGGLRSLADFAADAPEMLAEWAIAGVRTVGKIISIVVGLLFLQALLTEFSLNRKLTVLFRPLLRGFGLPDSTHFLWIVANTLGLAYGSAVLISEVEGGRLDPRDADLLNRHIAVSHSLLEDTLLFAAIGVPAFWITVPRVVLAVASVWITRSLRLVGRARRIRRSP